MFGLREIDQTASEVGRIAKDLSGAARSCNTECNPAGRAANRRGPPRSHRFSPAASLKRWLNRALLGNSGAFSALIPFSLIRVSVLKNPLQSSVFRIPAEPSYFVKCRHFFPEHATTRGDCHHLCSKIQDPTCRWLRAHATRVYV